MLHALKKTKRPLRISAAQMERVRARKREREKKERGGGQNKKSGKVGNEKSKGLSSAPEQCANLL